jgi:ATP-dependent Clp protease ATP-binding subunit ClpA
MFERFTQEARDVVTGAQAEARALRDERIGTEHLLVAALTTDSPVSRALAAHGLRADAVRRHLRDARFLDDGAALRELGIDIDEVRRRVEERFGPGALDPAAEPAAGHIRFSAEAKKALELAVREAVHLRSGEIALDHLVLGIVRADGGATRAITALGADPAVVRKTVLDLRRAA